MSGRGVDPPALLAFVTDGAHRALGALGATRAPSSTAPALRSRGCGMLLALSWPLRREARRRIFPKPGVTRLRHLANGLRALTRRSLEMVLAAQLPWLIATVPPILVLRLFVIVFLA